MIDDLALLTPLTPEELEDRPTISYAPPLKPEPLKLTIPRGGREKCWGATLTGFDQRYGFTREFLQRTWARDGWEFVAHPGTIVETAWPDGQRRYHYIGSFGISEIDREEAKTMLRCATKNDNVWAA